MKRLAILAVVATVASSRRGRTVIAKMAGPVAVQAIDNLHSEIEEMQEDYIRTAAAKGLHKPTIIMRHAFRNCLIPFVTIIGLEFGFLLSGVVVIETVFSWPGVGRLVFNSINQRDIPVVQAAVVMFSLLFVMLNLLVDIVYTMIDPRVRLN